MNKERKARNINNSSLRDNEDMPVFDYIDKINHGQKITMLEVGSGECRFVRKIKKLYPKIEITCIEINPNLAKFAEELGCIVINSNILDVELKEKYDIVHCSHVIEHFSYPNIMKVLDFLVSVVNDNGRLIIRSPLIDDKDTMCFYGNLDHIKVYPPIAIINYFELKQQQKQGKAKIAVETIWYRTSPKQLEQISTWHIAYGLIFFKTIMNYCIKKINRIYQFLWNRYRWPSTKPHGYVMIIKVIAI
ncbi:MAG: class I SAM-dependent methyltransferase [Bacteroidales bacterium]|nr:class I SAM-dependent methyltransferase [Bacteroidales bacterium]